VILAGLRQRLSARSVSLSFLLLLTSAVTLSAQREGSPAGGNWREFDSEDKMTAARLVRFELLSDNSLHANRDDVPDTRVELFCENGKYKSGRFAPGGRLGPPTHPGFWGQPKMEVRVRVDSTHNDRGWNWNGHFLSMDKDTVRELIGAQIFKIEFLGPRGPIIAEFSPAGLDLNRMSEACRLTPKKP